MTHTSFAAKTRSIVCALAVLACTSALAGPPAGSIVITETTAQPEDSQLQRRPQDRGPQGADVKKPSWKTGRSSLSRT